MESSLGVIKILKTCEMWDRKPAKIELKMVKNTKEVATHCTALKIILKKCDGLPFIFTYDFLVPDLRWNLR